MTTLRMLPTILAAAFAFAAGPAQAEMKSQWVEYSHGDTKLKAYMAYDDKISGKRPAVLVAHAREGMTPKTQALTELWAKLGYVSFAADIFGYGQGVLPKNVPEMQAQNRDLQRQPPADARPDTGGIRRAHQEPDGRPGEGRPHRLLLRRRGRRRVRLDRCATCRQCFDPRLVPRPSHRMGEERQGHVLILARRTGARACPLQVVDKGAGTAPGGAGSLPVLEVYSGTGHGFSTPKNKDRGARQRAVDRLDRTDTQGAFRHVSEAVGSARRRSSVETGLVSAENVRLLGLSGSAQSPLEMTRVRPKADSPMRKSHC